MPSTAAWLTGSRLHTPRCAGQLEARGSGRGPDGAPGRSGRTLLPGGRLNPWAAATTLHYSPAAPRWGRTSRVQCHSLVRVRSSVLASTLALQDAERVCMLSHAPSTVKRPRALNPGARAKQQGRGGPGRGRERPRGRGAVRSWVRGALGVRRARGFGAGVPLAVRRRPGVHAAGAAARMRLSWAERGPEQYGECLKGVCVTDSRVRHSWRPRVAASGGGGGSGRDARQEEGAVGGRGQALGSAGEAVRREAVTDECL